jgi:hypothetical protein
MTFEEFFKKKKIDLTLLQNSEPALFAEFKDHFVQMGEKSFDHTKKYWFNQIRRKYPAPPEVKVEKLHLENQIAEQTIIESLTDPLAPIATVGFKPRFKAGVLNKPIEEEPQPDKVSSTKKEDKPSDSTPPTGFRPRFKATMVNTPANEKTAGEISSVTEGKPTEKTTAEANPADEQPAEKPTKPTVGFKPRFKASMVSKPAGEKPEEATPAPEDNKEAPAAEASSAPEDTNEAPAEEAPAAEAPPKPIGFKPRFKPKE